MNISRLPKFLVPTKHLLGATKDRRERAVICKALKVICLRSKDYSAAAKFLDAQTELSKAQP